MPYIGNQHNVGDHVNNFKVLDDISSHTATFDGSATSVVSAADDTIRIPEHRFIQGQRVTYTNGGGGNIGGLTTGTAYFVSFDTANTIKLATTLANANSNTVINLSAVGSGTSHTLNVAFDGVNTKFKMTHGSGKAARLNNATQLNVAINNVIQRPNINSVSFTEGFAIEDNHKIVFKTAPTVNDVFWGSIIANTIENFDLRDNEVDNFTGDGSTTEFTLSTIPANNESVIVSINGVVQHPSDKNTARSYTLIDSIIQFTAAPALGDGIQVRHIGFAGASTNDVSGFYGRTGNVALTANDHITIGDIPTVRNINASGIITASQFVGNLNPNIGGTNANFTGIVTAGVFKGGDFDGRNLNISGIATFAGNVSIGGTLTYEDVTNIDSVGIITARKDIHVGAGISAVGVITGRYLNPSSVTTQNVIIGYEQSTRNVTGNWNVLLGRRAGEGLTSGGSAVCIGANAGQLLGSSSGIFIGGQAGSKATGGGGNVFIGGQAGQQTTSAGACTIIGTYAGIDNQGSNNTLVGNYAGRGTSGNTDGAQNTFIGAASGFKIQGGDDNTGLGYNSLRELLGGNKNVAIGRNAGNALVSGNNNIIIGYDADASTSSTSNEITLGDANINHFRIPGIGVTFATSGNHISGITTFTGNALFNDKVGIGSAIPENKLKINVASGNDGIVVQNTSTANIALIGARNGDATLQIGQYGSTASGNVFGIAAANLAFMYTTSYASTHPSALLIGNSSNKDIIFATNATARLRIHDDGGVTIGDHAPTTTKAGVLHTRVSTTTRPVVFENDTENCDVVIKTTGTNKHSILGFGDGANNFIGNIDYDHQNNAMVFDTNGGERLRIDSVGRVFINRDAQHASSSERLSVNGMTSIQFNSTTTAGLYIFNEETTTSGHPTQPFIFFHDGSGIRSGFGVQRSTGKTILGGHFGLSLRTGASGVGGTERLFVKQSGEVQIGSNEGGYRLNVTRESSDTTTAETQLLLYAKHDGSGNTGVGYGGGIRFWGDRNSDNVEQNMGRIMCTADVNSGTNISGALSFETGIAGVLGEKLRITSAGKVLVGDGSAITPSRNLDVRGTGHQQILLGSTNNAGVSLMLDGHGGGDGSGGNYATVEMGSDGNLDIRNYDPAKSIIFGTGSNTGSNDRVTIESDGRTTISNAELRITSNAAYTTHMNYQNSGLNYISTSNGGATYFRGSNNNITALTVKGDGEVQLNTANYKFTENNFLSASAATVNDATAQFTNAMTSLQGSYHSSNNTDGIMDFTDYKASDWNILDVYGRVNPNRGGSGAYSDPFFMTIYKGIGYTYPNVVTVIFAVMHTPAARTMYSSGTGASGNNGITAVWYNGSTESREFAYSNSNNAANYLRIKVPTSSFNTTHGHGFTARIFKRF